MAHNATNGDADRILRPRPVKPQNPSVLRTQNENGFLGPQDAGDAPASGVSR